MRKLVVWISVLAAAFPVPASAEIVQGKVVSSEGGTLTVRRDNPRTGDVENVEFAVRDETDLSGIRSLDELSAGDEIMIDAAPKGQGAWQAKTVVLTELPDNAAKERMRGGPSMNFEPRT